MVQLCVGRGTTKMVPLATLLLLVLGHVGGGVSEEIKVAPLVITDQGLIRGLNADDGDYAMFMGIPYGIVTKENPFGDAVPYPKFSQVFNAFDDTAICPQIEEFNNNFVGSLDCLHLNVYVPNKPTSGKIPVLVRVHGGGFSIGSAGRAMSGPQFFVRHDVIVVTLNYRLGIYGFMCLNTPEVPGNQGLKDQRLALRWIKKNIAAFGGDDSKITVVGESAGSASIELQLLSESEKLFDQVILQSGSALGWWAVIPSNRRGPLQIAERLGYATEDLSEAVSFLAKTDPKSVILASTALQLQFRPCVEKEFSNVESIITKHPWVSEIPKVRDTKVLAGFNNKEQLIPWALRRAQNFENLNPFTAMRGTFIDDDGFRAMEDIARRFYIGDEEVTEALRWDLMNFDSDWRFNYPTHWSVTNYLEQGAPEIYYYMFSYSGEINFVKRRFNITDEGAAHADELAYQFHMSFEEVIPNPEDQRMIDQMTTLWANFVKYGDPTPETSELLPVKWPPITKDVFFYLDLNKELTLRRRPYADRLTFFQLFYKANWHRLTALNV